MDEEIKEYILPSESFHHSWSGSPTSSLEPRSFREMKWHAQSPIGSKMEALTKGMTNQSPPSSNTLQWSSAQTFYSELMLLHDD